MLRNSGFASGFIAVCLASLLLTPLAQAQPSDDHPSNPLVRVRIASSQERVSLSGISLIFKSEHDVFQPERGRVVLSKLNIVPSVVAGRILWSIFDASNERLLHRFVGKRLEIMGENLRANLLPTPGRLELLVTRGLRKPRAEVIAKLDLETYLSRVLPKEMPSDWPIEALKAQAVASRSYALHRILNRERAGLAWHLESSVMDQVFAWDDGGKEAVISKSILQALRDTRGLVLANRRGAIVPGYFHADCGGHTEDARAVWGRKEPSSGTVVDGGCPLSPMARWNWSITGEELAMRTRIALRLMPGDSISSLAVEHLTSSGRVGRVTLSTESGVRRSLSGNELRAILGFDHLRSTSFAITPVVGSGFRFDGRGHGHGVGLCQWGSRHLANSGNDYRSILKHYYGKMSVVSIPGHTVAAVSAELGPQGRATEWRSE